MTSDRLLGLVLACILILILATIVHWALALLLLIPIFYLLHGMDFGRRPRR